MLNAACMEWLHHVATAGLLKKVMPSHIEETLTKEGYIHRVAGGYTVTRTGYAAMGAEDKK